MSLKPLNLLQTMAGAVMMLRHLGSPGRHTAPHTPLLYPAAE